jgi:hypothetical protein
LEIKRVSETLQKVTENESFKLFKVIEEDAEQEDTVESLIEEQG